MLTDVFVERYRAHVMFAAFGDSEKKLLVQASRIVTSQLFPYLDWQGKVRPEIKAKYEVLNSKLAMELGEKELGPAGIWYASGQLSNWYSYTSLQIAENFMTAPFAGGNADSFVKDRLSYVELAFRDREYEVLHYVASIDQRILEAKRAPVGKKLLIPGDPADGIRTVTKSVPPTIHVRKVDDDACHCGRNPGGHTEMPTVMNPNMAMMNATNPMATPTIVMRNPMY